MVTHLFLVPATDGVSILNNAIYQIDTGEICDGIEGLLLHHIVDIGPGEDGAADGRAVAALVAGVVLDVEDGFGIGGGNAGLGGVSGGAEAAVLEGVGDGVTVLGVGAGAGDLPWLFEEAF